ncbi:MAG: homing endonuclease, partial [Harvfovirus sp.]
MATNGSRIKRPYYIALISGPSLRLFKAEIGYTIDYKKAILDRVSNRKC